MKMWDWALAVLCVAWLLVLAMIGASAASPAWAVLHGANAAEWSAASAAWILGSVGLAVNLVGLIFIARQLGATREALQHSGDAARMAIMANRPWLRATINHAEIGPAPLDDVLVHLVVSLENSGDLPAIEPELFLRVLTTDPAEADIERLLAAASSYDQRWGPVFPSETPNGHLLLNTGLKTYWQLHEVWLLLVIRYRISGSQQRFITPQIFRAAPGNPSAGVGALLHVSPYTGDGPHMT